MSRIYLTGNVGTTLQRVHLNLVDRAEKEWDINRIFSIEIDIKNTVASLLKKHFSYL